MNIEKMVTLRPMNDGEINFILSSWGRSLRDYSFYHRKIPPKIYFTMHEKAIRAALKDSNVLVATPVDEPDIIIAYIVWEERSPEYVIIHYCYVKREFRKMGLGSFLMKTAAIERDIIATHYTESFDNLQFNPYCFNTEKL